jgi:hypothetical protein
MSEGREYTPYQRRVIRRYYNNQEDLSVQRLSEIVSDLYLTPPGKKADRLWQQAEQALLKAGANKAWLAKVVADRNLTGLAGIVKELF